MGSYLMVLLADLLLAAYFALNKSYVKRLGSNPKASFFLTAMTGLFNVVIFFVLNGFQLSFTWYSLVMAIAMNTLVAVYTLIGMPIIAEGGLATYSLFLMSGGMVVPYVWGLLGLFPQPEAFSWLRTIGLLIIIAAVVMSQTGGIKVGWKLTLLCAAVFFLNGFVSVVSKLHQTETAYQTVNAEGFVLLGNIFRAVLGFSLWSVFRRRVQADAPSDNAPQAVGWKILALLAAMALVNGLSYLLQLMGAERLDATVLYPLITGGNILFTSLAGIVIFKEKLTRNTAISIVLCIVGTLFFL